jgi:hypothetical protein
MSRIDDYNHFMDPRTIAASVSKPQFDESKMQLMMTVEDDDGEERTFLLPAKFCVCPTCNGKGKHVDPRVDAGGLTSEDFYEYGEEFAESYWNGGYDVSCGECGGRRVIPEVNEDALTQEQKCLLELWESERRADYEFARMCAMERAMGC